MAAFSATLVLSDNTLTVIPGAVVADLDTFDISLGRAGTITGLSLDNMNTVQATFKVSKVSSTGVVTDIIAVDAGANAGNEIVYAAAYSAAYATSYANTLALRSFVATDRLRVTCTTANSGAVVNIGVAFSRVPSITS